jgi:hypothetical protein
VSDGGGNGLEGLLTHSGEAAGEEAGAVSPALLEIARTFNWERAANRSTSWKGSVGTQSGCAEGVESSRRRNLRWR